MAFTYDQVQAITHDLIASRVTDGVFLSDEFLKRLREKQQLEDGGNKIIEPLFAVDETGTTGGFYSEGDPLSLQAYDGLSASEHDWKYLYESVVILKPQIGRNAGRAGAVKLVKAKVMQMENAWKERIKKGVLSDGTASTGELTTKQFVGLRAIIAASGTYGGIAPADLASWVSYVDDNGGTPRALTQAIVDKAFDETNEGDKGGATLGLMSKNVFSKFKGLLTGIQRTTRESTLDGLGHKGIAIVYNGIDHFISNVMEAQALYYIDERHAKLCVQRDNNMRRETLKSLETSDAMLERVFLYAAYVASQRKYHSKVLDITV